MRALLFLITVSVTVMKMVGDAILSALWLFNLYDAITAR